MSNDLRALAELVEDASGIVLRDAQLASLDAALHRLKPKLTASELLGDRDVTQQARQLARLLDELTIKETFFVRHTEELDKIDWAKAITNAASRGESAARVWSAGCSTGEEPYSLALLAAEALHNPHPSVDILGSDISPTALAHAKRAVYGARAVHLLSAERLERSFVADEGGLRVGPELRALVRFAHHNVTHDPLPPDGETPFDVVVCRNVLIYFDAPTASRVSGALRDALTPGGQLILGTADRLGITPTPTRTPSRAAPATPARPRRKLPDVPLATPPTRSLPPIDDNPGETPEEAAHAAFETGQRQLSDGDAAHAIEALRRALYLSPNFAVAAMQLGRGHEALGDTAAARRAYKRALQLAVEAPTPATRLYSRVGAADITTACRARLAALADH